MAKSSLSPSASSKDTSSISPADRGLMLESLISLARDRSDVECQQDDLPLVIPVIATKSLTHCLSTLNQDGSSLTSQPSSSINIVDGALKEPASKIPSVSTAINIAHSKALCSPGTELPVMVKPTTHVDLLHSTPLYYTDDLENFNVVQEETVPMETKSDEESESFIPPVSRKPRSGCEGLPSSSSSAPLRQSISVSTKSCVCGECGKVFATKRNLSHHIKVIHVSEQTYSCQVCSKVFRHFHNMNIHKQTQHHFTANEQHLIKPAKNFECPVCQKIFQHKSNLVAHSRLHSGERPFKCTYCGRGFVQSSNCKKHELTHTHQRPYSCIHCPKSFTSSCNLQRHQLSHHGGKNFLCPFCGKSFTQRWNLKKHEKRHMKDRLEKM